MQFEENGFQTETNYDNFYKPSQESNNYNYDNNLIKKVSDFKEDDISIFYYFFYK